MHPHSVPVIVAFAQLENSHAISYIEIYRIIYVYPTPNQSQLLYKPFYP